MKGQRLLRSMCTICVICVIVYGSFVVMRNLFCSWSNKCWRSTYRIDMLPVTEPPVALPTTKILLPPERSSTPAIEVTAWQKAQQRGLTRTQYLQQLLQCNNRSLVRTTFLFGRYWVITNFVRGSLSMNVGCAETITYTTIGDYKFFDNLAILVQRWRAPISFAVYTPSQDFDTTMNFMQYARNCLPESELIRKYVTFHIFFMTINTPDYVPLTEDELFYWDFSCDSVNMTDTRDYLQEKRIFRSAARLSFPINMSRNVARMAVNTYFIIAADIEFYPSVGLVDQFLNMLTYNESIIGGDSPRVFVLPVFEVENYATVPEHKTELLQLLTNIGGSCDLVPQQDEWYNLTDTNRLTAFTFTKREGVYASWEPFYISDNNEPYFDERVTWEGQSSKRAQGYAMCLLGYEYHVLHPAFLVHSSGVKVLDKNSGRLKFVLEANRFIRKNLQPEYRLVYGLNNNCRV